MMRLDDVWDSIPRWLPAIGSVVLLALLARGVLRVGLEAAKETFERELMVLLVGSMLGIISTLIVAWLSQRGEYRKGAYTERAKAVQDLLDHARSVKDACVKVQAGGSVNTLEEAMHALRRRAWWHDIWVGRRGVTEIAKFTDALDAKSIAGMASREEVEKALAAPFEALRRDLCRNLGFQPK